MKTAQWFCPNCKVWWCAPKPGPRGWPKCTACEQSLVDKPLPSPPPEIRPGVVAEWEDAV